MSQTGKRLLFVMIVMTLFGVAYALNYQWLTDNEITSFGDRPPIFMPPDTFTGDVHSNSQIAILGATVFYGRVSTTEDDFWRGTGYNPQFLGPPPYFNAPIVPISSTATRLREACYLQSHYYASPVLHSRLILDRSVIHVYQWPEGTPFDSSDHYDLSLAPGENYFFFLGSITISGTIEGRVVIGTSERAGIADNILYADSDPLTGSTPDSSTNYFALVAEGEIKVLNTVANGRENSGGLGWSQLNSDSTSVVLCGAYYALDESITFENQNDPDSGYVCECQPDERGTLYLYGGMVQMRKGYLHRSTRGGTGYLRHLRFDPRLRGWDDLAGPNAGAAPGSTDTLRYEDIPLGATVWDTAYVYTFMPIGFAGASATFPWYSPGGTPAYGDSFAIPCRFTPPHAGTFQGVLSVFTGGERHDIVLLGNTLLYAPDPSIAPRDFALSAYPNPFNATTTIRYTLASSSAANLSVVDLTGREVQHFNLRTTPGEHTISWHARGLATGLYFARLMSDSDVRVQKLLLLK